MGNGPLLDGKEEIKVKQRAKRTKISEEEANTKEERPEDIKGHTARGADQLSAVQQNICDVNEAMRKKVDKTYNAGKRKLTEFYGSRDKIPPKVMKKLKEPRCLCCRIAFQSQVVHSNCRKLISLFIFGKTWDSIFAS